MLFPIHNRALIIKQLSLERKFKGNHMDLATLIILFAVGNGVSALIFLRYISSTNMAEKSIKYFAVGKVFQTIVWLIFIIGRGNHTPLLLSIAHFFQYFGLTLEGIGMISAISPISKKQLTIWFSSTSLAVICYWIFSHSIENRVVVTSISFFSLYGYVFLRFIKSKNPSPVTPMVAYLAILFGTTHLVRGIIAKLHLETMVAYNNNITQSVLGTVIIIVTFTFPIFLLLLVKERDNERLRKLHATKVKFFRIIGHDLKAPFCQLHSISQLIEAQKENITPNQLENLSKTILDSSLRTSKLLDDVLTWAKVENDNMNTHPENLIVKEIVEENLELINHKAFGKKLKIINHCHADHKVYCDKNIIHTILRNLLSNAIKFSFPESTIEVMSMQNDRCCTISVKDFGVGIKQDSLKKIFKIDSDYSTLGTNNEKGTGVGLSLCKELVEKSGGKIWAESIIDKGTTFYFAMPIDRTPSV